MVTKRTPTIDGSGKLLEKFLPDRLGDVALGTKIAGEISTPGTATATALNATYAGAFPDAQAITYNTDGSVATVTENGITTSYTYNSDGTVATDSRTVNGVTVTRNYGYTNGNLTSITKAA